MNREAERKRLVERLDEMDLFLRNRACAKKSPLNEYDIGIMQEYAKVADEAARMLENAVVPPVKVGDKVYKVLCTNIGAFCGVTDSTCDECPYQNKQVVEGTVLAIKFSKGNQLKVRFDIFTDYFCEDELCYTREDALKALEGSGEK